MVICKVGVAPGTATTGDIMMIPHTHVDPNLTGVNNPLPKAPVAASSVVADAVGSTNAKTAATKWAELTATPEAVPAILDGYAIACDTNKYTSILAGTDANLGAMTFISNGNTVSATLMQAAALTSGTADELNSLKDGATTYNDNTDIATTTAD